MKYVTENNEYVFEYGAIAYKIKPEKNSNGKITSLGKCFTKSEYC